MERSESGGLRVQVRLAVEQGAETVVELALDFGDGPDLAVGHRFPSAYRVVVDDASEHRWFAVASNASSRLRRLAAMSLDYLTEEQGEQLGSWSPFHLQPACRLPPCALQQLVEALPLGEPHEAEDELAESGHLASRHLRVAAMPVAIRLKELAVQ